MTTKKRRVRNLPCPQAGTQCRLNWEKLSDLCAYAYETGITQAVQDYLEENGLPMIVGRVEKADSITIRSVVIPRWFIYYKDRLGHYVTIVRYGEFMGGLDEFGDNKEMRLGLQITFGHKRSLRSRKCYAVGKDGYITFNWHYYTAYFGIPIDKFKHSQECFSLGYGHY